MRKILLAFAIFILTICSYAQPNPQIIKRPTMANTEIEPDGINQFKFLIEYYPGNGYEGWILFHKD